VSSFSLAIAGLECSFHVVSPLFSVVSCLKERNPSLFLRETPIVPKNRVNGSRNILPLCLHRKVEHKLSLIIEIIRSCQAYPEALNSDLDELFCLLDMIGKLTHRLLVGMMGETVKKA